MPGTAERSRDGGCRPRPRPDRHRPGGAEMRRSASTPVAILVAVLAALVVAVIAAGPASGGDQNPSSTANGKAGTLALYQWLAATGDTVHRDDSSFDLGGSDVLISAAPLDQYAYSRAD